jgi:hypothetical protein
MNEDHYKKLAEQQRAMIEAMGWSQPSLRDQFAMAALTGLLANPDAAKYKDRAEVAYNYADAMMEARK